MGIAVKTVEEVTCDLCGHGCEANDGDIRIQVDGGYRDVGPATITATLRFHQPYGISNGILCKLCSDYWIKIYAESL